jgi:hypothetical protein
MGDRGHYRINEGLMIKLGIEPPDTPFNRRADEYARHACKPRGSGSQHGQTEGPQEVTHHQTRKGLRL